MVAVEAGIPARAQRGVEWATSHVLRKTVASVLDSNGLSATSEPCMSLIGTPRSRSRISTAMALLRALARRPGRVVPRRNELLAALPGGSTEEHAVETAITRLRAALGDARLVQTVVKRGYRLAPDPAAGADAFGDRCLTGPP